MALVNLLPQTERETLKFRLLALLVVSVAVLLRAREVPLLPAIGLIGAYLVYNFVLRTLLISQFTGYRLLAAMMAVDAAILLAAIYLVGVHTPIVMLLTITVVYYGLYMGYAGGLAMATIVSFGFVALVYGAGRLEEMATLVAIQVPSSFLLALLVGYLTQARLRESEERRTYQQLLQTEAQGRRLLELASSLGGAAWEGLAPADLARAASAVVGLPWAAVLLAEGEGQGLALAGASYAPGAATPVPTDDASAIAPAWLQGQEVERLDLDDKIWLSWAPAGERPGYLWALPLGGGASGLLCVLGPPGARMDERRKEALRAFASLAGRVVAVRQRFFQVEGRSRDIVGEMSSTVETTGRLVRVQSRRSLRFGQLTIDPQRERVRLGAIVVHLSRTEFDLLYALASSAGSVLNAEILLRTVWGPEDVARGKPVDVAIHRLRRKLDALPGGSRLIRTVRGRGYTFAAAEALALSAEATARGAGQASA